MASAVGTVTFAEQPGSPVVAYTPEGVITVTRTRRGRTTNDAALKAELDLWAIGAADATFTTALLESKDGSMDRAGGYSVVRLQFRGGLSSFVEFYDSPRRQQRTDGTWIVPRRFIGPRAGLDAFLAAYAYGSADGTYGSTALQTRNGQPDGPALAIAELNYEGTIGDPPAAGTERQVIRNFIRSEVTFSPWSKGGFRQGPEVVGTYYRETVRVDYTSNNEPASPQFQNLLSSGVNTFIFEWNPASFDPECAPHGLQRRKITENFHTENITGTTLYRCSETHSWIISETPSSDDYSPGAET